MSERAYNFNPGPAVLPLEVLETVRDNLLCYKDTGIGVMEMSHRSAEFIEIIETAEADLRELLDISDDYAVCFPTGGATQQSSMIAMNFLEEGKTADYIITGSWAKKAQVEAEKFGSVHVAASSETKGFNYIPTDLNLSSNSTYLHFTSNNTIAGTQYHTEPEAGDAALICDACSDLLHKKIDINKYGVVYASAQKNLGPAGVSVVILRKDLLERIPTKLPALMNYDTYVAKKSLYNTPPTFPIYVVGEVFKWLKNIGGLEEIERRNQEKAAMLYEAIDSIEMYNAVADKKDRSLMNVTFRLTNEDLEKKFVTEATALGLCGLKGHRSVGGIRASIYNAFPKEGIVALTSFMKEFAEKNS